MHPWKFHINNSYIFLCKHRFHHHIDWLIITYIDNDSVKVYLSCQLSWSLSRHFFIFSYLHPGLTCNHLSLFAKKEELSRFSTYSVALTPDNFLFLYLLLTDWFQELCSVNHFRSLEWKGERTFSWIESSE